MADTKISALPASTTPLAGTEVLPIVQSSATVKVSVSNLTAGRDVALKTVTATAAATQDGVALAGRAGGTSSYIATITPTTLSASCTVTLPNANTSIPVATQILTFSGPTAARTITLPDANFTVARTDAGQTFTGAQQVNGLLSLNTASQGLQTTRSMSFLTTGGSVGYISHSTADGSGDAYLKFGYNGTEIGSITQNGTTGVLYNVTSDYRLKTVIGPVVGSGERIDALNPVEYEWKSDNSRTKGFLAHEFQAIYSQSVTGTKDGLDDDGNPKYQNMQASTSEVIADLVAEIKSLRIRIAVLEAKG
jgi:hypothetical protein